jgi:hypothetical protein
MASASANPIIQSGLPATIDDLYRVDGKAELVDGRIVRFMPTGDLPSTVAFEIARTAARIRQTNGRRPRL